MQLTPAIVYAGSTMLGDADLQHRWKVQNVEPGKLTWNIGAKDWRSDMFQTLPHFVDFDKSALSVPVAAVALARAREADAKILDVKEGVVGLHEDVAEDPIRRARRHLELHNALAPFRARDVVGRAQREGVVRGETEPQVLHAEKERAARAG